MNYFLILIILATCGFFYYEHAQDQQQVALLQDQVQDLTAKAKKSPTGSASNGGAAAPGGQVQASTGNLSYTLSQHLTPYSTNTFNAVQPAAPPAVAVLPPDASRSSGIDSAAAAASAAENGSSLGTITTLDGRSFQDCKVLKVESDGITFSHADGITKILFPLLQPDLQKKYGYDPQKAVAATAAQINYQQATQQNGPPANSSGVPAATTPNP